MADETTDKPLAKLAAAATMVNPPVVAVEPLSSVNLDPGKLPEGYVPTPEPMSAAERLRAFEDKHFGEKAVRINGRIERGFGSPFQMAHPWVREHYAKIEKLIAAEQKLADAHAILIAADAEHELAAKAVTDDVEAPADGAADE